MKSLLKACIAMAAFAAFAVIPTMASASNAHTLTAPTGTSLSTATHAAPIAITGTHSATGLVMTNTAGEVQVRCDTAELKGNLETATGTATEGTITAASFNNHKETTCTGTFGALTVTTNPATNGLPWCLRSTSTMKTHEFQVRGNGCTQASRPIRFVFDIVFGGTCVYERTTPIIGTYTTGYATLTIEKQEFKLVEGSFVCPSHGLLDLSFTLEKGTTPVAIDAGV